jgi:hypothetical protein
LDTIHVSAKEKRILENYNNLDESQINDYLTQRNGYSNNNNIHSKPSYGYHRSVKSAKEIKFNDLKSNIFCQEVNIYTFIYMIFIKFKNK